VRGLSAKHLFRLVPPTFFVSKDFVRVSSVTEILLIVSEMSPTRCIILPSSSPSPSPSSQSFSRSIQHHLIKKFIRFQWALISPLLLYNLQVLTKFERCCLSIYRIMKVTLSVGKAPVCQTGGSGFKPGLDQQLGSYWL